MRSRKFNLLLNTRLEVVEKLCNKVAIIKQGEIVAQGETHSIIKDESLEQIFLEITEEK